MDDLPEKMKDFDIQKAANDTVKKTQKSINDLKEKMRILRRQLKRH